MDASPESVTDKIRQELSSLRLMLEEQLGRLSTANLAQVEQQDEIRVAISKSSIPDEEKEDARSYRKKNFRVQVILAIGTWGAFLAAAIYAGIAEIQLRVTDRQLIEAQKTTVATEVAMKIDERAWVSVLDIRPDSKGAPIITIEFINTGRTPAKDFRIAAAGDVGKVKYKEVEIPGSGVIAPGGKFSSILHANGALTSPTRIEIHGRVSYESVFGVGHWTTFCYYLIPRRGEVPAGFAPCESGNEIDNNPEK